MAIKNPTSNPWRTAVILLVVFMFGGYGGMNYSNAKEIKALKASITQTSSTVITAPKDPAQ
jgi:hypothetical protein